MCKLNLISKTKRNGMAEIHTLIQDNRYTPFGPHIFTHVLAFFRGPLLKLLFPFLVALPWTFPIKPTGTFKMDLTTGLKCWHPKEHILCNGACMSCEDSPKLHEFQCSDQIMIFLQHGFP